MAIGYRTNITALKVKRLNDATLRSLGASYNQLSSGLRINRASDDPAGLALAAGLNADGRIANRARLNVDDGISFLNVADGVYTAARGILTRLTELANQSANGSLTSAQRTALGSEFSSLVSEMTRMRESATFNGEGVLSGQATNRAAETVVASGNSGKVSADGRYITYLSGTSIRQLDRQSGSVTTIAASSDGSFDVSDTGDRVIYTTTSGTKPALWDRTTGAVTSLGTLGYSATTVALSGDGGRYAFANGPQGIEGIGANVYDSATNSLLYSTPIDPGITTITSIELSHSGSYVSLLADTGIGDSNEVFVFNAIGDFFQTTTNSLGNQVKYYQVADDGTLYFSSGADFNGIGGGGFVYSTTNGASYTTLFSSSSGDVANLQMQADKTLTFEGASNPLGQNPSLINQVFQISSTGTLRQLTTNAPQFGDLTFSADGLSAIRNSGGGIVLYDLRPEYSLKISAGAGASSDITSLITSLDGAARALGSLSISSQRSAREALKVLSDNSDRLGNAAGQLGAGLSRLSAGRRLLLNSSTETAVALDRVRSLDVAQSVAQQARLQILSETQTAMLAQAARLEPSIALSLLQAA